MPPVNYRGVTWDVDGGGVACIIEPGHPTSNETQCPSSRLDKEIQQAGRRKARLQAKHDEIQAELDAVTQAETDLVALRAAVTSEP